jgi:hypothetical protein
MPTCSIGISLILSVGCGSAKVLPPSTSFFCCGEFARCVRCPVCRCVHIYTQIYSLIVSDNVYQHVSASYVQRGGVQRAPRDFTTHLTISSSLRLSTPSRTRQPTVPTPKPFTYVLFTSLVPLKKCACCRMVKTRALLPCSFFSCVKTMHPTRRPSLARSTLLSRR